MHRSTDLIINAYLPVPPYLASSGYLNMGGMTNRGMEVRLQYQTNIRKDFIYTTDLNFSMIRTSYNSLSNPLYSMDGIPIRYPGAGGCSCTGFIRIKENEPAGQFYGPVFQGIDDDGKWILSNEMDYQKIGNGLPTSFLGWSHSVHFRNWKVDLLVRGVFGHDLISVARMLYENRNIGTHNTLKSTPKNLDDFNTWSSYYVEKGDYLKLDNLTFSYYFPQNRNRILKEVRIFVSVDNLLTITKYSGTDPSARLTNRSSFSQYKVMAPGIDSPATWLDARTFMTGLDLYF